MLKSFELPTFSFVAWNCRLANVRLTLSLTGLHPLNALLNTMPALPKLIYVLFSPTLSRASPAPVVMRDILNTQLENRTAVHACHPYFGYQLPG